MSNTCLQSRILEQIYLLLLLLFLFMPCCSEGICFFDEDCGNKTLSCCRRPTLKTVCKRSCTGESCLIDSDCGTDSSEVCCRDQICRDSQDKCSRYETPSWIFALRSFTVVVLTVFIPGYVAGGIIAIVIYYYKKKQRQQAQDQESERLLRNQEPAVNSTSYGAYCG